MKRISRRAPVYHSLKFRGKHRSRSRDPEKKKKLTHLESEGQQDSRRQARTIRLTFVDGVVLSLEKVCRWTLVGEIEDCEVELIVLRAAALRLSDRHCARPLWDTHTWQDRTASRHRLLNRYF